MGPPGRGELPAWLDVRPEEFVVNGSASLIEVRTEVTHGAGGRESHGVGGRESPTE
ncbi:hypothetical protein [Arthrobacter sp. HLT1-20]